MSRRNKSIESSGQTAEFIRTSAGNLFCLVSKSKYNPPDSSIEIVRNYRSETRHVFLIVPPFGEELNLCRRFLSLIRNNLVWQGFDVLQPDLFGTGDSEGNFEDSTWDGWCENLDSVIEYFCSDHEKIIVSVLALRGGGLLAQEFISRSMVARADICLGSYVVIQPVLKGVDMINRLFRARLTAQRLKGGKAETIDELWSCIDNGESVLAGGYILPPDLCGALRHISLDEKFHFFEKQVVFDLDGSMSGTEFSDKWRKCFLPCAPFWQSYDIEPECELVKRIVKSI